MASAKVWALNCLTCIKRDLKVGVEKRFCMDYSGLGLKGQGMKGGRWVIGRERGGDVYKDGMTEGWVCEG
jgi:hypothetical protein